MCEVQTLIPYLNPFGSCINGCEDEDELEEYVFPIYDKDNDDEYVKFGRMNYATYLVNVNLKRVAEKVGIGGGITFYSARHSYASNLYHSNVPVGLIAQNMGRNPADIETYLKEFDKTKIIAANEKAFVTGQDEFRLAWEEQKKKQRNELNEQKSNPAQMQAPVEKIDRKESLKRLKEKIEQEFLKQEQEENQHEQNEKD